MQNINQTLHGWNTIKGSSSYVVHVQLCTVYNMTVTYEISSLCDTWNPSSLFPSVYGMAQNQNNYLSLWTKMLTMWKHYFYKNVPGLQYFFIDIWRVYVYVLKTKLKVLKYSKPAFHDWLIDCLLLLVPFENISLI